jgi:hypothetical protein
MASTTRPLAIDFRALGVAVEAKVGQSKKDNPADVAEQHLKMAEPGSAEK